MSRKNPFKGALILTIVALGIAALTYFVVKPRQEARDKDKEKSALLFGDLDRQKIVEFLIQNPNGTFQLKADAQNNDRWILTADGKNYEADKGTIDGIVSTMLAAKRENAVQNTDLPNLGLNPPKFKLSLPGGKDGARRELFLGEDTPVEYMVYAKWSDNKPEAFLTTRSLRFSIDKKLSEFRNKKVFSAKPAEIARLDLKLAPQDKLPTRNFSFQRTPDGSWKALSPHEVSLDKAEVEKLIENLNGLVITQFVSENPEDRKKLGFGHPLAQITITPTDPKATPITWALASTHNPTPKFYFARLDKESTYEVADTFRDNFKIDFFHFRPKTITQLNKADVKGFTVQDGGTSLEFTREGSAWKLKTHTVKSTTESAAKTDAVEKSLDSLVALKAQEYFDGQSPAQLGLRKPSRVVEIRSNKDGKEAVTTLFFGKKLPNDRVVVRSEGLDAAAAVSFKPDEEVPLKPEAFVAEPPAPLQTHETTKEGSKKVKLEPTVKDIKDLRKLPGPIVKPGHKYTAVIEMAKGGKIVITFAADKAPYTVSNFLHLARNHFYDGVKFHRVIPDFVAQGGDPTGTGSGGPGWKFDNEDNDLKHKRGAISMAHAGRNTNGSQFFLVLKPQPHLDGIHPVFGEVTEGLDVMDAIKPGDVMKKVEVFEEAL